VLRAIVENWADRPAPGGAVGRSRCRPSPTPRWPRFNADPRARQRLADQDIPALASALTWLGERLYYLAATGTPALRRPGHPSRHPSAHLDHGPLRGHVHAVARREGG